jgi:hypothetical protein
MIAQALPKTDELINEINAYIQKSRRPTDWQIKLLTKKANDLQGKIADYIYYELLGSIACLANDSENLIRYFEMALQQPTPDPQTQYHYLVSLNNIGFCAKALSHGKGLLSQFPDEDFLRLIIQNALYSGRFQEARQFLNSLKEPYKYPCYQDIADGSAVLQAANLNDDETERLQQLAFSVIPKMGLFFSGANIHVIRNCIHYEIFVDLPIEDIFDVNWELSGVWVENTHNQHNHALTFEYSSVAVLDERRAS